MKSPQVIILIILSVLTFSCVDNLTDYSAIQPTSDAIEIGTDTFHLNTETFKIDSIYSRPDSFLLGTFYNTTYGSTQADLLVQVNCPLGFRFPVNAVPDSAFIVMYYKTWFGDNYGSLDINLYEMNLKTFSYSGFYPSNLKPTDYSDLSVLLGRKIVTAKDATKMTKDSTAIVIKLSNEFIQRFANDAHYGSSVDFTNFFKGIYVTTKYGSSSLLNIRALNLDYYYHYTYVESGSNKRDTVSNLLTFPANKEVRQVNRFLHPDRDIMVKQRDSVNYVASPANLQTRINLPLVRIKQKIDQKIAADKKHILNKAILKVEATEVADSTLAMPLVSQMLLIKESAIDRFFKNKELPSDTCAIRAQVSATEIGTTGVYEYYYYYDIAKLIANELKKGNVLENLNLVLVPVTVTATTSSSTGATTITAVKQQYSMSGVTIRSGKNEKHPMKLNLIYSGF